MSFKIEGLDQLSKALGHAARDKKRYNQLRYDVGKKHLQNCAAEVPVSSGRLRASFKRELYKGQKEWILFVDPCETIEVGTKVWYARMVEDGHKLVKVTRKKMKNGRIRRTKKNLGFVPGTHFFKRALEKTNRDIPEMVDDFIREIGKEAGFDVS